MSQVMKALQRSEQSYQTHSGELYSVQRPVVLQRKAVSSGWILLCLLLPVCVALGLQWYQVQRPAEYLVPATQAVLAAPVAKPVVVDLNYDDEAKVARIELGGSQVSPVQQLPPLPLRLLPPLPGEYIAPATMVRSTPALTKTVQPQPSAQSKGQAMESVLNGRVIDTEQHVATNRQQKINVDDLDLSGVSPELAAKFKLAFDQHVEQAADMAEPVQQSLVELSGKVVSLESEAQRFRGRLPKMDFQTHMYASNEKNRWVKVNGKEVYQGEWIVPNQVKLITMTPRALTVQFQNQLIEIPALYEWRG